MRSMHIEWHCVCGDGEQSHRTTAQGEECWGHCQSTLKECGGRGFRPINHSERTPAIEAILEVAIREQKPTHFSVDLSSDYRVLMEYSGSFIWILRSMGTEFFRLDPEGDAQGQVWYHDYARTALKYHQQNHATALVFYWNSLKGELVEVSYDTALAIAAVHAHPNHRRAAGVEA